VRDIQGYRQRGQQLPRILVVFDEFQRLFDYGDNVTTRINNLFSDILSRGRSTGIHILLSTQSLRALLGVTGFNPVKSKLNCRIALACSKDESEFILETGNYAAGELRNTTTTKFGVLNEDDGQQSANNPFVFPYVKEACEGHQAFLASQARTAKKTTVFSGATLPKLPSPDWFTRTQRNTSQIILGEELNFESAQFSFNFEPNRGGNLLIAGADKKIHDGLLRSLLLSTANQFSRIIYFNTNRSFTSLGFSCPSVEIKRYDWDGNIANIVSEMKRKKALLIIDSLENARVFPPPEPYGIPNIPPTSGELLKQLLDEGTQYGSHVVAFTENWRRFESNCRNYLNFFDLRIGYNLDAASAGSLTNATSGFLNGLDHCNKAVFADLQTNRQVLFRPFVMG
jgi:hypothetical protein